MSNKSIKIYWLVPIIITSGIFGYYTSSYSLFKFKYEIDIINFISLILTSSIGFYIASSLRKNIEAKKFEKELSINLIKLLLSEIKSLDMFLSENNLLFNETVILFKSLSSNLSELKEINEICRISDDAKIEKLRELFFELKQLITGGNIRDGKLLLTIEHKGLSKTKLKYFRNRLISLMVETNRK